MSKLLFCLFLLVGAPFLAEVNAQQTTTATQQNPHLKGVVVDAETGDSMAYVKLQYVGQSKSYLTSIMGEFDIPRRPKEQLVLSAFGYKDVKITVGSKSTQKLKIRMKPDLTNLGQVEIKAKKKKYVKKDNPAVELMQRVVAANKATDLRVTHDFVKYNNYQKITLCMNEVNPDSLNAEGQKKKKQWYLDQIMFCKENGKYIMPVNYEETVSECCYRRDPSAERFTVLGKQSDGVNKLLDMGQNINYILDDLFKNVDIYKDNVDMLQFKFLSPIASSAPSFYHYFLSDTTMVGNDKCIRISFAPSNPQDFGFSGDLYVLADSSLHVRRCHLNIPQKSDVNWVTTMKVDLEYEPLPNGEWALTNDDMFCELTILSFLPKAAVYRTTRRTDYSFDPIPDEVFSGMGKERIAEDAEEQDSTFWQEHRTVELTQHEQQMGTFVKGMKKSSIVGIAVTAAKVFLENYIPLGNEKHPAKVDFGPLNTLVSRNSYDGVRLRLSAATNGNLSKHIFATGYLTKGLGGSGDGIKLYGGGELTYSFNKKNKTPDEYPKRKIYFRGAYDNMAPADRFSVHDKDNIFTMFKWTKDSLRVMYTRFRLGADFEQLGGLEYMGHYNWEKQRGCLGLVGQDMTLSEFKFGVRFAPGERVITTKQKRIRVNKNTPIFELSHTAGIKGFLGGTHNYNTTEFSAYYRMYFNGWGRVTTYAKGCMQWNQVPYLLLQQPPANTALVGQLHTFNLLSDMEFLTDRYVMWDFEWDLQGKILNRIPLVKKLKWREHVGFKGVWGMLSDKNKPNKTDDKTGYWVDRYSQEHPIEGIPEQTWPSRTHIMDMNKPYMEFIVGIHNIFNVFCVEYVRRLTYTDITGARNNGVRFKFEASF